MILSTNTGIKLKKNKLYMYMYKQEFCDFY